MVEYVDVLDNKHTLTVETTWSRAKMLFKAPITVLLANEELRRLRDQINEHLGELPKPLPVGTIVVGEGLTDSQKEHLDEVLRWVQLKEALHGVSWRRTHEGGQFWAAIVDRISNVITCMNAEKKRREQPVKTHVAHFTVCAKDGKVNVSSDPKYKDDIFPGYARALAAALNKHADAAENASRQ